MNNLIKNGIPKGTLASSVFTTDELNKLYNVSKFSATVSFLIAFVITLPLCALFVGMIYRCISDNTFYVEFIIMFLMISLGLYPLLSTFCKKFFVLWLNMNNLKHNSLYVVECKVLDIDEKYNAKVQTTQDNYYKNIVSVNVDEKVAFDDGALKFSYLLPTIFHNKIMDLTLLTEFSFHKDLLNIVAKKA